MKKRLKEEKNTVKEKETTIELQTTQLKERTTQLQHTQAKLDLMEIKYRYLHNLSFLVPKDFLILLVPNFRMLVLNFKSKCLKKYAIVVNVFKNW